MTASTVPDDTLELDGPETQTRTLVVIGMEERALAAPLRLLAAARLVRWYTARQVRVICVVGGDPRASARRGRLWVGRHPPRHRGTGRWLADPARSGEVASALLAATLGVLEIPVRSLVISKGADETADRGEMSEMTGTLNAHESVIVVWGAWSELQAVTGASNAVGTAGALAAALGGIGCAFAPHESEVDGVGRRRKGSGGESRSDTAR
jgi:hypothetical protein